MALATVLLLNPPLLQALKGERDIAGAREREREDDSSLSQLQHGDEGDGHQSAADSAPLGQNECSPYPRQPSTEAGPPGPSEATPLRLYHRSLVRWHRRKQVSTGSVDTHRDSPSL